MEDFNILKRFVLIKNGIHTRLDHVRRGLTRMKKDNFLRLVRLVIMTEKRTKRTNIKYGRGFTPTWKK